MFTPAATAARTASEPEWWKVPSPRFWTRWLSSVNGAMPIHCAPSPPICVMPVISPLPSGFSRTIVWQPMPAPTSVPSGAFVELLCGQPEQKNGVRCAIGGRPAGRGSRRACASRASTESIRMPRAPAARRRRGAIRSASRSSSRGSSGSPRSSRLPRMRGRPACRRARPSGASRRTGPSPRRRATSSSPRANSRAISRSSGQIIPSFRMRTPARSRALAVEPESRRACIRS